MYATCLFCNAPFEKNESLEAFPVGRRLAFDAAKGRLWVVCRKCERWSLSPLDERWEAIEQAERLFRDTRKRVSTDNIGLAKVAEGTTLVRIGNPLRPEFAAWRYGDQFGRRRQRQMIMSAGGVAALGALTVGGAAAGASLGGFWWVIMQVGRGVVSGNPEGIVAKLRNSRNELMSVRRKHLTLSKLRRTETGSMELELHYIGEQKRFLKNETTSYSVFHGPEAQRMAAILLPKVNRFGASKGAVAEAVGRIEAAGTPQQLIGDACAQTWHNIYNPPKKQFWSLESGPPPSGLFALPAAQRLALEMALHEETERRALEGELKELERAWRDAEEIAAIADNLAVPEDVDSALDKLKRQ